MCPERSIAEVAGVYQPDMTHPCYLEIDYKAQSKDRIEAKSKREAQVYPPPPSPP